MYKKSLKQSFKREWKHSNPRRRNAFRRSCVKTLIIIVMGGIILWSAP